MNKNMQKLLDHINTSRHNVYVFSLSEPDQQRAKQLFALNKVKVGIGPWSGELYYYND